MGVVLCTPRRPARWAGTAAAALAAVVTLGPAAAGTAAQTRLELDAPVSRPAARPLLSLGEQGGSPYEFFQVAGAVRLRDGRLAVLNAGTHEVRIYGPDGTFEAAHGGEGEGPGEFTRAQRLFSAPGDSLIVWDGGAGRASVLTADNGFSRTAVLDPRPDAPTLEGISDSGRLVVSATHFTLEGSGVLMRMPQSRFLYSSDGARLDSLGLDPGRAGLIRASPDRVEVLRPLVAVTTTYAVGREFLWIETGERHGVELQRLDTGVSRSFIWDGPSLETTDAYVRTIKEARLRGVEDPEERRRIETANRVMPVPERIPATERVLSDRRGRGWVELAGLPGEDGPAVWVVISPEGVVERRVELPRRMTLLAVDGDDVIVVERDDFDIEYVRQYALEEG